jgi:hypothetical protein
MAGRRTQDRGLVGEALRIVRDDTPQRRTRQRVAIDGPQTDRLGVPEPAHNTSSHGVREQGRPDRRRPQHAPTEASCVG